MNRLLGLLIALALLAVAAVVLLYNGLVRLRNEANNAWAQIDVQLQRRHDLIPNLVETVRGYMRHERELLERVTEARSAAVAAQGVGAQSAAENILTSLLGQLRVAIEAYPDLKASTNVLALQEELASTENKLAFARQYYNDSVMHMNTKIEVFPSNLVAGMFGFTKREFFELDDPAARQTPVTSF